MLPEGETLIYVTTPQGVTRVRSSEMATATGARLVSGEPDADAIAQLAERTSPREWVI